MTDTCPECSAQKVTNRPHRLAFDYAAHKGMVSLEANVTLFRCAGCGFSFLDHTAEEAKDDAVRNFLTASERIIDLPGRPVVWVSDKNAFYDCSDDDFKESFIALCKWSTAEPNGPGWVAPVLHDGMWSASARHNIGEKGTNIVVRAVSPEGATVALAVVLELRW